ncbi:MAG: sigma-70 family RNA polymerase sigma factor [Cyclobacteriaceae bacterium]
MDLAAHPGIGLQKAMKIEETVRAEGGRLLGFIRKFVPDKADAEDIMQDVFYQLAISYDDIRSVDKISGWLFRVARNKITDKFRKKKPENFSQLLTRRDLEDGEAIGLEQLIPDLSHLPDEDYLRDVIWQTIETALEKMPAAQRDVFIKHELEQKSYKEMEVIFNENINTLLSRKRYAIQFLRKELETFYNELLD